MAEDAYSIVGRKSLNVFQSSAKSKYMFVNILMGTKMLFRGLEDDRRPTVGNPALKGECLESS
jgi:hypothetical protein